MPTVCLTPDSNAVLLWGGLLLAHFVETVSLSQERTAITKMPSAVLPTVRWMLGSSAEGPVQRVLGRIQSAATTSSKSERLAMMGTEMAEMGAYSVS